MGRRSCRPLRGLSISEFEPNARSTRLRSTCVPLHASAALERVGRRLPLRTYVEQVRAPGWLVSRRRRTPPRGQADSLSGRALRFCRWRMRRSVVSSNSKPATSAASNSAPLLSLSQPFDCADGRCALTTPAQVPSACRGQRGRAPAGSSERRLSAAKSRTANTCSRVTSNCPMTSSMLGSSRFSMTVGHGQTSAFEHPGAAYLAFGFTV